MSADTNDTLSESRRVGTSSCRSREHVPGEGLPTLVGTRNARGGFLGGTPSLAAKKGYKKSFFKILPLFISLFAPKSCSGQAMPDSTTKARSVKACRALRKGALRLVPTEVGMPSQKGCSRRRHELAHSGAQTACRTAPVTMSFVRLRRNRFLQHRISNIKKQMPHHVRHDK